MNHRLLNHNNNNNNNNNNENSRLLHWHYSEFDDHNFQIHGQTLFYLFILFSIILLVTLLLLYARWYFRFRHAHHVPPHTTTTYPHVPLPHAGPMSRRGLHPLAIKAIPIILHQVQDDSHNNNNNVDGIIIEECCICLGVFEDGDKVKVLPKCDHRFHSECVDRWLLTQSSCPLCRLSFRVDPVPLDSVILPPV